MNSKKIDLEDFNFKQFQKEFIEEIKAGRSLNGKDGILTPLIKELIEASLDGEMDAHLSECKEEGQSNRRNGKLKKTMKTCTGTFEL